VRILLATDAASEGIDLQRHCHQSGACGDPLESQPVGAAQRPHRPLRAEAPAAHLSLCGQGLCRAQRAPFPARLAPSELEADLEFLARVAEKVDQMREDLGTVGQVIADSVAAAMLDGRRVLETGQAERRLDPVRRQLKFERNLREQIERHSQQLGGKPADAAPGAGKHQSGGRCGAAVGRPATLQPSQIPPIPPHAPISSLAPAAAQRLLAAGAGGAASPAHPGDSPVTFDNAVASGRDDVVLVHLNHPLVQISLRLLRAEVWANTGGRWPAPRHDAHRAGHLLATPAVIAHARLVIVGGDSQRLHEEIITAGGEIREGRFRRMNVTQVSGLLTAASEQPAPSNVQEQLLRLWPTLRPSLLQSLDARAGDRGASLQAQLAERAAKEAADITAVLEELARSITNELNEPEFVQMQLDLWPQSERDQFQRNQAALRKRLAEIPGEIDGGDTAGRRALCQSAGAAVSGGCDVSCARGLR
jgi:hypothetical protein